MTIIIFIIILAVLILVHEFGHFIVAKIAGVRVDEFAIGFPPKVFSFKPKKSDTRYSLNLIPFGGFVKIFGENPDKESISGPDSKRSFVNKPKWIQASILSAGVLFNIIFAWILISISFMSGVPTAISGDFQNVKDPKILLIEVLPGSPAEMAGLKVGDEVVFAESKSETIQNEKLTISFLENLIAGSLNSEINISYKREGKIETTKIKPISGILDNKPAIGIAMSMIGTIKLPFYKAPLEAFSFVLNAIKSMIVGIFGLIKGAVLGEGNFSSITGPVGIVGLVGQAWNFGFVNLMMFTAFISINLAVINIVPFPALDGGRILFILIEKIKGSVIKPKIVNAINGAGFFLLIILMFVITYNDISRLFQ
ncbi:MAG: RIP metalloprotease RseP [Candidatus Paceibacterota bacterium]